MVSLHLTQPARSRLTAALLALAGCSSRRDAAPDAGPPAPPASASDVAVIPPPPSASPSAPPPIASAPPPLRCPKGMMRVKGSFCVDKWEASLVDHATGMPLSPYYPPDRRLAIDLAATWETERLTRGDDKAREVPVPELPAWQRDHDADPMAMSRPGVKPNGYLSGVVAARACENAKKRLCRLDEWRVACEGEAGRPFPYGDGYTQGACNVFRATHPAVVLHGNASIGHLDPRLNQVADDSGPLLRATGATPRCKSEWGEDAAWDMNGNLDEWVDATGSSEEGDAGPGRKLAFAGAFYSRAKRDGCASLVTRHEASYLDYSLGVRCCWSPEPPPQGD